MVALLLFIACVPKQTDSPAPNSDSESVTDSRDSRDSVTPPDSETDTVEDSDSDIQPDSETDTPPPDSETDTQSDSDTDGGDTDTAEPLREMDWVLVPASTFQMGCTAGQGSYCGSSETEHTVTLTHDYYVLSTEVTQLWYARLTAEEPSYFDSCGWNCPVEQVSWHDAAAFANLLSDSEGLEECYACDSGSPPFCEPVDDPYACLGYRLLTEAEWEGAARCGTDLLYSGSDDADDVAWYHSNAGAGTEPVAGLLPNACGLYDMSGNVLEWVEDVNGGDYGPDAVTDPVNETDPPETRIARGGDWRLDAENSRIAKRWAPQPWFATSEYGFRLALTAP